MTRGACDHLLLCAVTSFEVVQHPSQLWGVRVTSHTTSNRKDDTCAGKSPYDLPPNVFGTFYNRGEAEGPTWGTW